MKYLLIILLLIGCTSPNAVEFQNTEEFTGYISNEHHEPVVFKTDSSAIFVYGYDFDAYTVRVKRTIIVREENGKYIFIAELDK